MSVERTRKDVEELNLPEVVPRETWLRAHRAARARMGWRMPWYFSAGSTFDFDFHVTLDERVAPLRYAYRPLDVDGEQPIELPGLSCFLRVGDRVFHTYSAYARGAEVGGSCALLDLTALAR